MRSCCTLTVSLLLLAWAPLRVRTASFIKAEKEDLLLETGGDILITDSSKGTKTTLEEYILDTIKPFEEKIDQLGASVNVLLQEAADIQEFIRSNCSAQLDERLNFTTSNSYLSVNYTFTGCRNSRNLSGPTEVLCGIHGWSQDPPSCCEYSVIDGNCVDGTDPSNPLNSCRDVMNFSNPSSGFRYIRLPNGQIKELWCETDVSLDGGGWELVYTNAGGNFPSSVQPRSDSSLHANQHVAVSLAPVDIGSPAFDASTSESFAQRKVETGLEWLKVAYGYKDQAFQERFHIRVQFSSNASLQNVYEKPRTNNFACHGMLAPIKLWANGTYYGQTSQVVTIHYKRGWGLANSVDTCGGDYIETSGVNTGASFPLSGNTRSLFSYMWGVEGRDTIRCSMYCWQPEHSAYYQVVEWYTRPKPQGG